MRLPVDVLKLIFSFYDPIYQEVVRRGGAPSALALKRFEIRNFFLEPWCHVPELRRLSERSPYWIDVQKIDSDENPDIRLVVLGLSDGEWHWLWGYEWRVNSDKGNLSDNDFTRRRAWMREELCVSEP